MVSRMPAGEVDTTAVPRPDLVELLSATTRRVSRAVASALAEDGGTLEGYRVLRCLAAAPGRTMGQLISALHLPGPTATRVVDGLVDAALAYRLPDPDDRRRVVVHPSALGRTRLARWEGLVAGQEAALARSLGEDRIGALVQALSVLTDESRADR
jgi:DNA-binding MarR family transcriptional regulator